ncbi:MAG TPA: sigma-54-dependent Fis family transcriptional regulator, partial [Alphaproteobacteria bacterium]|nr:sigma-54-dependent Fis family transcriptional regulator [Alphaproteobacteria bacterium]
MIRLVLFSGDPKLQRLLAPALGQEFSVLVESDSARLKQIVIDELADVVILDLDSNYSFIDQQLAFVDEIRESRVPVVAMTDDIRRST